MSLQPGQITSADLSPNAGILGTQIADKTLQLRNFNEDVLKVSETTTATITGGSVGNGTIGDFNTVVTFKGQYSNPPIVLAVASAGGTTGNLIGGGGFGGQVGPLVPDAYSVGSGSGVSVKQAYIFGMTVTTTNVTFYMRYLNGDSSPHNASTINLKIYVLSESAT